jgi:hypothetical protein
MLTMTTKTITVALSLLALLVPLNAVARKGIDLESTFIGDKEQPSVSYFVPWKPPEGPSKLYRPIKSISGNILDPIDRDVMARGIQFYNELSLEKPVRRK